MRKSKKRKPDFRRIRPTKTYSLPEIAEALDRDIATVRRWVRDGLPTLDGQRPPLVLGSELKAWLKAKWSARKQPCQADELRCCTCGRPRRPSAGSFFIEPKNAKTVWLNAKCCICGGPMKQIGSRAKLPEIQMRFGALSLQKQRLERCSDASAKHTSESQSINKAHHPGLPSQISIDFGAETGGNTNRREIQRKPVPKQERIKP